MPFFSLGGANRERVVVTVLRHERTFAAGNHAPDCGNGDKQYNNWLAVEVAVWFGEGLAVG